MAEEESDRIVAQEIRAEDRKYTNASGELTMTIEKYILAVLPENIQTAIRSIALYEINGQMNIGNNPSQILVDNMSGSKREIAQAKRRVNAKFQDTTNLLEAVKEIYALLQQITRIQNPAQNDIVARDNFYLFLNGVNLGLMPMALTKIAYPGMLTADSIVRVVGPLVNYGRKLFWNPVGASSTMNYYRTKSKRSGVRFMVPKGSSLFYPRFRASKIKILRRKANRGSAPALALQAMLSGKTPPGRIENVGQMVKRIITKYPQFRGLHFTDGWLEYAPAIGWSKLRDPRVPAFGVMFAKKGKIVV